MRIVSGILGGRTFRAPPGDTRPTQEKVRAAVFSSLAAFVPERRVLDLFAGSGALGLEAWSRGAAHVEWVENAPPALRTLKRNLADLGVPPAFRVHATDAFRFLEARPPAIPFHLVLADPPYREALDGDYAARLRRGGFRLRFSLPGALIQLIRVHRLRYLPSKSFFR